MMALAIRYEVSTQVLSSTVAESEPAMCGSATLAMLVSSTSMKVASITVMAISQGFTLGISCGEVCLTAGAADAVAESTDTG